MRELELMKKNLEYKQLLCEEDMLGSSTAIIDDFTKQLKHMAFEWGTSLVFDLLFNHKDKEQETEEDID